MHFDTRGTTNFSNPDERGKPQEADSWWGGSSGEIDGCHFKGSFPIQKVKGTLLITAMGHGFMGMHTPHDKVAF